MQKLKTITSWLLIVVGCLMFATFGMVRWTEQQVLNTDNWVSTMAQLPQDEAVAKAIGTQIVDRMFEGSDVTGDIRQALPPRLIFLAPTISNFLREKADALATQIIMSDRFTQLWTNANRVTHENLIETLRKPIADGEQTTVLPYKINLAQAQQWLQAAAEKTDNPGLLNASDRVERVETFNASLRSGLNQMRAYVRVSDALYAILPYAILAAFLGALALAKNRYKTLLRICSGVVMVNVLAIAGVNFVRPALLNALENQTYRPIFSSLWDSLTPPFLDFARTSVVVAAVVMLVAFLWHKGMLARVVPTKLKRQSWYKKSSRQLGSLWQSVVGARQYVYVALVAIAVLYIVFWPSLVPLDIVRALLLLLSFASIVSLALRPNTSRP